MREKERLWNRHYTTLFLVNILVAITLYMTNTLMVSFLSDKGIATVTVGSIVGMMSIASMCIRPFSGWVADRSSKKSLLIFFLIIYALVMLGYCVANAAILYYILRIIQGIAFGIVTTAILAYVSDFIPNERLGEGIGFFGLGQSIAAAIGPFIGIKISQRWSSNYTFCAAAGSLFMALLLVVMMLPKTGKQEKKKVSAVFSLKNFIAREALLYSIITIAISAVNGVETSYIVSYAASLSIIDIGWYFTISATVLFLARLCFGKLTDKHDFSYALYPGLLLIITALGLLGAADRLPFRGIFALAATLKALGVGILQPALQANCLKAVEPERRGVASSTYYIGTDLGQGLSTVVAGHLIFASSYSGMYFSYIIPLLMAGGLYMVAKRILHSDSFGRENEK